jgi:hypothetical protein
MTIEVVILLCVSIYGGVELIKHFVPDFYSREKSVFTMEIHNRLTSIEKKLGIDPTTAATPAPAPVAPAAPAPTTTTGAAQ